MDGCLPSGTRRSSAQATAPHAWAFRLCRFPHTLGLPCLSPLTPGGGGGRECRPHYHKLWVSFPRLGNSQGRHARSAVGKPRPGRAASVTTVSPPPGKCAMPSFTCIALQTQRL